ncbi:MAG: hypothetical protein K6A14_02825 [Erysipelotrichaceae bacterium]|nr:hypothetical protein [Erysipelotrichaceae bacterium]
MEFTGKRVNHIKDGPGTIIAFYPNNNLFKVKFDMGRTSFYNFPRDFYPNAVLAPSPAEIINYVNSLPRAKFSSRILANQSTANKSLSVFSQNALAVLSDLNIPYNSESMSFTINNKLKTSFCRTVRSEALTDSLSAFHYEIQVNPMLLEDAVADRLVYSALLREIIHVIRCTVTFSNSTVSSYIETIARECNYQLDNKLSLSELPVEKPKAEASFSLPLTGWQPVGINIYA